MCIFKFGQINHHQSDHDIFVKTTVFYFSVSQNIPLNVLFLGMCTWVMLIVKRFNFASSKFGKIYNLCTDNKYINIHTVQALNFTMMTALGAIHLLLLHFQRLSQNLYFVRQYLDQYVKSHIHLGQGTSRYSNNVWI